MSLWERLAADDLAVLAVRWLLMCAVFIAVYVWAARRWAQRRPFTDEPDRSTHRVGSLYDFRGQLDRSRWP